MKKEDIGCKLNSSLTDVADGLRVEKWVRSYVFRSLLSSRLLPHIGQEYMDAVSALDDETRKRYQAALVGTRDRASSQADFVGIIGLPLVIAFLAADAFQSDFESLAMIFGAIGAYVYVYYYYRMLHGALNTFIHVAELAVATPASEK